MFRRVAAHAGGVVMIVSYDGTKLRFLGSGFLCHRLGYILTSAHIIKDITADLQVAPSLPISEFGLRTSTQLSAIKATVAQFDTLNDVALLKLAAGPLVSMLPNWMGRGEQTLIGTSVGTLGIPFGARGLHTIKLTGSLICGKSLSESGSKQLHLDANIHEGNSGGPVIEVSSNQIIGIVSGRYSPTGNTVGIAVGDYGLGQDSTISFSTPIEYGAALMQAEGLDV